MTEDATALAGMIVARAATGAVAVVEVGRRDADTEAEEEAATDDEVACLHRHRSYMPMLAHHAQGALTQPALPHCCIGTFVHRWS